MVVIIKMVIIVIIITMVNNVMNSQQQNALAYNLSMQGIGTAAIDGPRFQEFLRRRGLEVSQGGLARYFSVGLPQLG